MQKIGDVCKKQRAQTDSLYRYHWEKDTCDYDVYSLISFTKKQPFKGILWLCGRSDEGTG